MGEFAIGKHAKSICQRCGWAYDYRDLRKEWNGLWVCETCFEEKHPLITPPRNINDPEALRRAFPDDTDFGDEVTQTIDDLFPRTANPDYS